MFFAILRSMYPFKYENDDGDYKEQFNTILPMHTPDHKDPRKPLLYM